MKAKHPPIELTADDVAELLASCVEEGDCLLWTMATSSNGLPMSNRMDAALGRKRTFGVRAAISRSLGHQVNASRRTAMKCGNRLCLNPEHMVVQSLSALVGNAAKRDRSGWNSAQRRMALARHARERFGKLTDEAVADIRSKAEPLDVYMARYGISRTTVSEVRNGHTHRLAVERGNPWAGLMRGAAA